MKKFLSVLMAFAILVSSTAVFSASAENHEHATTQANPTINGEDGSLASLLSNSMEEINGSGYVANCITDLIIEGSSATVEFNNDRPVKIIVAVYDDGTNAMTVAASADVTQAHAQKVEIKLSADKMPQYFTARAFILDEDNKPIGSSFENFKNTKAHREFLKKTVDDFKGKEVLSLDDSKDNNFAVFKDDVIKVVETETENKLVSADKEAKVYKFKACDDVIKSVSVWDKIYYQLLDGSYIIIEAKKVSRNGDEITITGDAEVALDDVFGFVKIDVSSDPEDAEFEADPEIKEGYEEALKSKEELAPVGFEVEIFDEEKDFSKKIPFNKKLNKYCELTGYINFGVTASIEAYLYDDRLTATVKLDQKAVFNLTLTGKYEGEFKVGNFDIPLVPGVSVGIDVQLKLSVNGEISFTVTQTSTLGFTLDTKKGRPENISKPPKINRNFDINVDLYVGLEVIPNVAIFDDVFRVGMVGEIGVNLNITNKEEIDPKTEKHLCKFCLAGTVTARFSLDLNIHVDLKLVKDFDWKHNLFTKEGIELYKFYISDGKIGEGDCPNRSYKVNFYVVNSSGEKVANAKVDGVSVGMDGMSSDFVKGGNYSVLVTRNGYLPRTFKYTVNGPGSYVCTLYTEGEDTNITYDYAGTGVVLDSVLNSKKMKVYFSDDLNWGSICVYAFNFVQGEVIEYFGAWPGAACTDLGNDIWSAYIPVDCSHVVFSSAGDTYEQTNDIPRPEFPMMAVKGTGMEENDFGDLHPIFNWKAIPYDIAQKENDTLIPVGADFSSFTAVGEDTASTADEEPIVQKYSLHKSGFAQDSDYLAMVVEGTADNYTVTDSDMLYLAQVKTDSEGELKLDYYCTDKAESWVVLLYGPCKHEAGEFVTVADATETEAGLRTKSCINCGEILETEEIPMIEPDAYNTVYFVDTIDWGRVNIHYWYGDEGTTWPGFSMTYVKTNEDGDKVYSYSIPKNCDGVVFNCVTSSYADASDQTCDVLSDVLADNRVFYPTEIEYSYISDYYGKWKVDYYDNAHEETLPTTEPADTTIALPEPEFDIGDVNMDSKINIKDATAIQKCCAKMIEFSDAQLILADFDKNTKVNVKDATMIQKFIAGLI